MIIHIASLTLNGIDITDVDVQVQISPGIPSFTVVTTFKPLSLIIFPTIQVKEVYIIIIFA